MKFRKADGRYNFKCPGCGDWHVIDTTKGWRVVDPESETPNVEPSLLVTSGHFVAGQPQPPEGPCWCTFTGEGAESMRALCYRCHSIIFHGKITFCPDSSHKLSGQTVDLPDL